MARKSQRRDERRAEDEVTEAGMESFPASDPPAYNTPGRSEESDADASPHEADRAADEARSASGAPGDEVPPGPPPAEAGTTSEAAGARESTPEGAGRRSGKVSRLEGQQRSRARHLRRRPRDAAAAASGDTATTAELRGRMPSRRTAGKTSAEDPAAAPFDTDDEAAGRPAQASAIEEAMARQNVRVGPSHSPATPTNDPSRTGAVGLIAAIVLIVAVLGWLFFG